MSTGGTPRSSARAVQAARRRARAVELRAMRRTFQQIADTPLPCPEHESLRQPDPGCSVCLPALYSSRGAARRAVLEALEEGYPLGEAELDTLRREQLATIDLGLQRLLRDVIGGKDPIDRARAATAVARLLERQAKVTGMDAATRVTITDELDEAIAAALADLAETPMPAPAELVEP